MAEDIVHQAFLKIIDNLYKVNEINCHKTKGYILVIVENLSIGFYRKRKSVEAYRVKIFEVITKVWEEFTSITFKSEEETNDGNLVPANPEYIPEGFSIVEENSDDYMNMIIYINTDNIEIFYEQSFISNKEILLDTEGVEVKP